MTKQKIIKIVNKNLGYNYNNGVIPYITDKGAEKLLVEFEKEKQELTREIFLLIKSRFYAKGTKDGWELSMSELAFKQIASEHYGVEL